MTTGTTLVPIHPEAIPGRPDQLRWRIPPDIFTVSGHVIEAGDLVGVDGPVLAAEVTPGAVLTTLAPGRSWRQDGASVRTALHAALRTPDAWLIVAESTADAVLEGQVREAIAGSAGAFVRSHGGTVEVVSVREGVVTVRLGGACDGCPALGFTVGARLAADLRRACPSVREVRTAA